jgi:alanyl-tRNA synthetase
MVCGQKLECNSNFIVVVADMIIETMKDFYPSLTSRRNTIIEELEKEVKLFSVTLDKGYKLFESALNDKKIMDANVVFKLVETYGFPYEIIKELANERNVKINDNDYFKLVEQHKQTSRGDFEIKGMSSQAGDLVEFNEKSEFIYDSYTLSDAKVIAIFDKNFNRKYEVSGEC